MEGTCGASRQMKHVALDEAIVRLEKIISGLEDLYRAIDGSAVEKEMPRGISGTVPPRDIPTLLILLDSAPGRLESLGDRARKATEEIRAMLF